MHGQRWIVVSTVLWLLGAAAAAQQGEVQAEMTKTTAWDFETSEPGSVPEDWRIGETNGSGTPAGWAVVQESDERVFALTETRNSGGTFNLAIAEGPEYQDLDLSVRVRADSGAEDQGGGAIWRCVDENNYYVCRFNPLEKNYRVYKVVEGKRTQLDTAPSEIPAHEWATVRVTMNGSEIRCYLNGQLMLEASDRTFPGPGLVGLWTKADAATSFDELHVAPVN